MERNFVPVLDIILLPGLNIQLFLGIINQGGQRFLVLLAQSVAELLINLSPDCPGTVFQHMIELLILSVNIRHKMLGSFGQI